MKNSHWEMSPYRLLTYGKWYNLTITSQPIRTQHCEKLLKWCKFSMANRALYHSPRPQSHTFYTQFNVWKYERDLLWCVTSYRWHTIFQTRYSKGEQTKKINQKEPRKLATKWVELPITYGQENKKNVVFMEKWHPLPTTSLTS